jgi:hypothetical protein
MFAGDGGTTPQPEQPLGRRSKQLPPCHEVWMRAEARRKSAR